MANAAMAARAPKGRKTSAIDRPKAAAIARQAPGAVRRSSKAKAGGLVTGATKVMSGVKAGGSYGQEGARVGVVGGARCDARVVAEDCEAAQHSVLVDGLVEDEGSTASHCSARRCSMSALNAS